MGFMQYGGLIKPNLSSKIDSIAQVRFPVYASPKIDGFRILLNNRHPLTRRLRRFPNEYLDEQLFNILAGTGIPHLDGEVVVGKPYEKGILQLTSSGVTTKTGTPAFRVYVFDAPHPTRPFIERLKIAEATVEEIEDHRIYFLEHVLLKTPKDAEAYLEKCLAKGYEGIMFRDPDGLYKEGKSTVREGGLLKWKPFEDAEGEIVDWFEEQENTNEAKKDPSGKSKRSSHKSGKIGKGRLGGFILKDLESGVTVRVGGGFTQEQRIDFWERRRSLMGKVVKYSKQVMGEKDKPRHPNFLDFRHEVDL